MSDYIGDIASLSKSKNVATVKSKSDSMSLNMQDFLQMMVAQFQNQDPENAASTTDMLNQMVQMSMIQAITNITDAVSLSYSASLVGKEVTVGTFDANGNLKEIVGTVTGTGTYNGSPVIFVNGETYSMSSIMAVGRLPDSKDPPTSPDSGDNGGDSGSSGDTKPT
ncbi:flagellar hook assembly protein FlgD [Oscillibacter ruminantium]|uniref:flagellar hook assembly protein FlgD n=1 Tax=Oscillibacter ruminantium TaxID=1263547 RepID=UPI00031E4F3C|nr:flagellar hook capping FlgD N-terminal domain-containing protein [Oscillibacter ruminantium]MDN0031598.1 flagellar hook capping FlgD N-terminal domain-containing protein [Oscillibacter valericigenes]